MDLFDKNGNVKRNLKDRVSEDYSNDSYGNLVYTISYKSYWEKYVYSSNQKITLFENSDGVFETY